MMKIHHDVIWFNAEGDQYRGGANNLDDAIRLLRTAVPRDAVRAIVKAGRKIVHREAISLAA